MKKGPQLGLKVNCIRDKTVVRSIIKYRSAFLIEDKNIVQKMNVAETSMLKWMSGVTGEEKVVNEYIKGTQ